MGLLFRAVVYFGLYIALVLLPLALALFTGATQPGRSLVAEFSAAAGLIGFAVMAWEFALIARLRAASAAFGTDVLMQFHRQMGVVALLFVMLHLLTPAGSGVALAMPNPWADDRVTSTGAIAFWAVVLITVSSIWRRRLAWRYETWRRLHGVAAVTIVLVTLAHALAAGGYVRAGALEWLVVLYGIACITLLVRYRIVRPLLLGRRPWEVESNRDDGGDTRTLRLRPVGHAGLAFEPGQFVWLLTGRGPLFAQQHPITLSSSSELQPDRGVELSIKALGDWSRATVPALTAGSRVWLDGAYGTLTPDRYPGQGFVLVAGGIGISPMRSILLTMRDRGDVRPVILVYGANRPERMVFRQELEALRDVLNLTFVPVYESPPPEWNGERGFVTEALLRRHLPAQYRHFQFFVCGPAAMMDAVEVMLLALEVSPARIGTERFDMG